MGSARVIGRERAASRESKLNPKPSSEMKDHLICENRNYTAKISKDISDAKIMPEFGW